MSTTVVGSDIKTHTGPEWASRALRGVVHRHKTTPPEGVFEAASVSVDPSPSAVDETESRRDDQWALARSFGTYMLADSIARRTEGERGEKMVRVVKKIGDGLGSLLEDADLDGDIDVDDAALILLDKMATWSENDRTRLLIDLAFSDPFFPYDLKIRSRDFQRALETVASRMVLREGVVAEMSDVRKSALRSHRSVSIATVCLFGAGGVLLLGTGAFLVAPALGAYIGGLVGLSGAAAESAGLAALGGGAIANGGAGVAGGLWLVAEAGAAAGGLGGAAGAGLYQLGARQAKVELTRLQVTFKMTVLGGQVDLLKAQRVVANLNQQLLELKGALNEERLLNDDNSARIKELEDKIEGVEETIGWMNREAGEVR